ncbi:MAG: PepSY-associated TM helix domain-containing protein [Armatimonadota bacterium]
MVRKSLASLRIRSIVFLLHQWLGVVVGGYFVLMAATGILLLYADPLDRIISGHLYAVSESTPASVDLTRLVNAVETQLPAYPIEDIRLPRDARDSVLILSPGSEGRGTTEIYVDPRSYTVLGTRLEADAWNVWVYGLHVELKLASLGKNINGILAMSVAALLGTALPLWWPKNRHQVTQRLLVKRGTSRMRWLFDVHNVAGIYAYGVLITVVVTGVYFVYQESVEPALLRMMQRPVKEEPDVITDVKTQLSWSTLLASGEAVYPNGKTTWVNLPLSADKPFRLTRIPEHGDWLGREVNISLNPGTGESLSVKSYTDDTAGQAVLRAMYPIHTGAWAGDMSRLVYAVVSLAPGILLVTGIAKWRLRNKQKSAHKAKN